MMSNSENKSRNKAFSKNFIYDLYKTYEAAYGDSPNARQRTMTKLETVTNINGYDLNKILHQVEMRRKAPLAPKCAYSQKWAKGISDDKVKAIEKKILYLSAANNGIVPMRRMRAELIKDELFNGSFGTLHRLVGQMGFFYRKIDDKWKLFRKESPIDEQLNPNQRNFTQFSNMMEVKHSPASQMEFRSTTNGLPENEVEDLDTLFDDGVGKSLTPPSDECDSSTPILNGIVKHSEELTSAEILDGMEIDLIKDEEESNDKTAVEAESTEQNKENEEAEGVSTPEIDLFELGLEEGSTEKVDEFKDAASVRDTGDDLDTLLSKINDLVEDCMETKVEGAAVSTEDEVVEIPDDDADDVIAGDVAVETTEKSSLEMEVEEDIKAEVSADAKVEVVAQAMAKEEVKEVFGTKVTEAIAEKAASPSIEEAAAEQMEVDADLSDDIVCLDSPLPEESKADEDDLMNEEEEVKTLESTEKSAEKEEDIPQKDEEPAKKDEEVAVENPVENADKPAAEKPKAVIDDEIYLIEDDDDDDEVPAKDASPSEKANEKAEDSEGSEEIVLKTEKDIENALDEICRTPEDEHSSNDVSEDKPSMEDDDDDDIVCLDDLDKEDEVKEEDENKKEGALKEVLVEKEEDKNEEDKNEEDKKEEDKQEDDKKVTEKKVTEKKDDAKKEEDDKKAKEENVSMNVVETIEPKEETPDSMDEIEDKVLETTEKVKEAADKDTVEVEPEKEMLKNVVGEEVVQTPVEKISAKPVDEVVKTTIDELSAKPVQEAFDKPLEEVVATPVEEVVEKPVEKAAENSVVEAVEKPIEEVVETILEEVVEKQVQQAVEKPAEVVIDKPVKEVVEKPVEHLAEKVLEEDCNKADEPETSKADDKKAAAEPKKPTNIVLDDDIVILDDDDEDDEATSSATTEQKESTVDSDKKSPPSSSNDEDKKVEETTNSEEVTSAAKSSAILSDNSDNARDGVEEKADNDEANEAVKENIPVPSESNSCSSSSNLLKETIPEEREDREEHGEQPPAKRIRLSQDEEASSRHSTVSMDDTKSNTVDDDEVMEIKNDADSKSLKRVHSTESIASDFKKPKTDEDVVKVDEAEVVQLEPIKKKEVEVKPLALYPPPKLDPPTIDLSLDFLKRFKKSIHKMTKCDLEELVLQKIVEAIVHKSEFSEMRELIEKQEKVISSHRTKITELNKQFRDLEMVHNRVLKDLETKNSQFIMPVKITRAVGLQVFFPNKKNDQPLVPHSPVPTQSSPRSGSSLSNSNSTSSTTNSMPEKSSAPATPTNTPTTSSSANTQATVSNNIQPQVQRRGCVQKLTPMRPDTPRNSPLNRVAATLTQQSLTQQSFAAAAKEALAASNAKVLSRSLPHKGRPPVGAVIVRNAVGIGSPPATPVQPAQLAASIVTVPKQSAVPPGIATKKTTLAKGNTGVLLGSTRYQANQPKNYLSDPQATAQPLPPAATIITPPLSLTPTPKPANKSVIDLTDEDDAVPTHTQSAANTLRTTSAMAAHTPPSVPTAVNRGPYKVSVIPQQLLQQPKPNLPKQIAPRPPPVKLPTAPKSNGVAITVRTGPANPSRYRHPAPLPNQPIHSSNPAWKLPPARPTIRISNLDSGIVISWTIEDAAKEKYAESTSYQIYAYQETSGPPLVESWRHVGDVKAMLLPMAVTLTQFQEGQRYYFAVRAVDAHNRCGPFSFAKTWS